MDEAALADADAARTADVEAEASIGSLAIEKRTSGKPIKQSKIKDIIVDFFFMSFYYLLVMRGVPN